MQFHPPKHQPVKDLHNILIYSIQRICMYMYIFIYLCICIQSQYFSDVYICNMYDLYNIFIYIYIVLFLCIHIYVYVHLQNTSKYCMLHFNALHQHPHQLHFSNLQVLGDQRCRLSKIAEAPRKAGGFFFVSDPVPSLNDCGDSSPKFKRPFYNP